MRLSKVTWTGVTDLDGDLALLPAGSTEQHDPHAPLSTGVLNVESVAEVGIDAFDGEVVIGPTIPVSVAGEYRVSDDTLWASPDTFRVYVCETIEPFVHHGLDRVVVVNGHGGDIDAFAGFCRHASWTGDVYAVAFAWLDAVGDHSPGMGHDGPLETALLRHTHPELVREDRIDETHDGGADHWGEWAPSVNLAHNSDEFTNNGVVGDSAKGDADHGTELGSPAADSLAPLLDAVESRKLD